MEYLQLLIEIITNMPAHLNEWGAMFGPWIYVILFLVIFAETGLVVTPFLPGDSLLFALGALAATPDSVFEIGLLFIVLFSAAVIGDNFNYFVGSRWGRKLIEKTNVVKPHHLQRTELFFSKYGGKTIILARFAPIVRTYAPFSAGVARMHWRTFFAYDIAGGLVWIGSFLFAGYFFGNIPGIQRNFHWVILAIIIISLAPIALEFYKARQMARKTVQG